MSSCILPKRDEITLEVGKDGNYILKQTITGEFPQVQVIHIHKNDMQQFIDTLLNVNGIELSR